MFISRSMGVGAEDTEKHESGTITHGMICIAQEVTFDGIIAIGQSFDDSGALGQSFDDSGAKGQGFDERLLLMSVYL